jgi:hypothetical protein
VFLDLFACDFLRDLRARESCPLRCPGTALRGLLTCGVLANGVRHGERWTVDTMITGRRACILPPTKTPGSGGHVWCVKAGQMRLGQVRRSATKDPVLLLHPSDPSIGFTQLGCLVGRYTRGLSHGHGQK